MNKGYEMSKHVKEFMLINEKRLNKQKRKLIKYFDEYSLVYSPIAMNIALKYHIGTRKNGLAEVSHQFDIIAMVIPLFEKYDKFFV